MLDLHGANHGKSFFVLFKENETWLNRKQNQITENLFFFFKKMKHDKHTIYNHERKLELQKQLFKIIMSTSQISIARLL